MTKRNPLYGRKLGKAAAAAVAAALAVTVAGCSNGGGESVDLETTEVELSFWNGLTGGDGPVMQGLVDQFMEEHPNISVEMVATAWNDYYQKLPAVVSNGTAPDVGLIQINFLATNAARGVIQPLDELTETLGINADDFPDAVWKAGEYRGERFGIPLDVHPVALYYNKTVLAKCGVDPEVPPTDRTEFEEILEACKAAGIQGFWVSPQTAGSVVGQTLVYQFGGSLIGDDQVTATFADQPGIDAVDYLMSLVERGYSPANADAGSDYTSFTNNESAFLISGPWNVTPLTELADLDWGVTSVPQLGTQLAAWGGSHYFVLPKQTKQDAARAAAAQLFIGWISEHSLDWSKAGQVPARDAVRESPAFADQGLVTEFAKALEFVHFIPPTAGVTDALPEWNAAVSEIMTGGKSTKDGLREAADRAERILEENMKKYG